MASIPAPGKPLVLTHRSGAKYQQKCLAYRGLTAWAGVRELSDLPSRLPLQPGER